MNYGIKYINVKNNKTFGWEVGIISLISRWLT